MALLILEKKILKIIVINFLVYLCVRNQMLLVACCDSRVVPNVFASSDPGDVFVLRNIGNIIPTYTENSF